MKKNKIKMVTEQTAIEKQAYYMKLYKEFHIKNVL